MPITSPHRHSPLGVRRGGSGSLPPRRFKFSLINEACSEIENVSDFTNLIQHDQYTLS